MMNFLQLLSFTCLSSRWLYKLETLLIFFILLYIIYTDIAVVIIMISEQPSKRVKQTYEQESYESRPIIFSGKSVYMFSDKCSNQIIKFIKQVCDPVSKPQVIHQYQITKQSLLRAQSFGYKKEDIIKRFQKIMRNRGKIPAQIESKIRKHMRDNNQCQLFLAWQDDSCFYKFVVERSVFESVQKAVRGFLGEKREYIQDNKTMYEFRVEANKHIQLQQSLQDQSLPVKADRAVYSFLPSDLKKLKSTKRLSYCHNIQINLKSFTELRYYQAQALNSIVKVDSQNIVSRSGYVVLPCGAGKTLLGISILCKIKKQALIVCSSDSGTDQWKREIQKWTQSFPSQQIIIITSENKYEYKNSVTGQIFISTYTFLKNHINAQKDIQHKDIWIVTKPWGLVIFDQCQTLPATQNRQIVQTLCAQAKIGLTATPLRQDDQIKNLNFMIGPQLYVGDWKLFVQRGYLANPKCIQVRTQLTPYFREKYQRFSEGQFRAKRQLCYKINPNKVKAVLYLLHHHQQLNDHILVFSDDISLLNFLSQQLKRPMLKGSAKPEERNFIFDMFRQGKIKTLLLSRIGDEAIDLPNANVGIELNIQHGSRKQMLQRLGRIMRQKQSSSSMSYNAVFYTITTYKTQQWRYFFKRYRYLIDEGFHYDLRLFQFKETQDFDNVLKFDKEVKEEIEQRFRNIIGSEERYWNYMSKSEEKDD